MSLYALVGRRGAYPTRWPATKAKAMYAEGVRLAAADILQVWQALDNGDLLRYDGDRTRKLTDKIVASLKKCVLCGKALTRDYEHVTCSECVAEGKLL